MPGGIQLNGFKAKRIKQVQSQRFVGPPDKVFPLLCPIREYEWIDPWKCEMLHSGSGVAEKHCVFRTRFDGNSTDDVWVISRHEPNSMIEFVRFNALWVMILSIVLADNGDGTTTARNEQILTGLTAEGNQILDRISTAFAFELKMGEAMLNHFLTTGKKLSTSDAVAIAKRSLQE